MTTIAAKSPKSLLKATDTLVSVAYFFSVDDVVDIVYIYSANIVIQKETCSCLYKKKLAYSYSQRILLEFIQKESRRIDIIN